MMVSDTVSFHVNGHCYYMEDGVEERNVLDHNLAAFVHVVGTPSAGPTQIGSLSVQVWRVAYIQACAQSPLPVPCLVPCPYTLALTPYPTPAPWP